MRRFFKPRHDLINHTPAVKRLNIRLQYRAYLAEMKAYHFYPMTFREWFTSRK
jgi:hypothetical protein